MVSAAPCLTAVPAVAAAVRTPILAAPTGVSATLATEALPIRSIVAVGCCAELDELLSQPAVPAATTAASRAGAAAAASRLARLTRPPRARSVRRHSRSVSRRAGCGRHAPAGAGRELP